ncbi:hypothetical protein OJ997_10430 [Solirubrobacter phytolaccae]|uniref:Uncharacterized protein n=1 Tax=Solirubrobacter phytolaccae TaxID=1404360 RepID=A0A9X3S769_9ACTN|nr:hypothetical protein [Solirubrobacter phytolaccae]MDA0180709.1 hypothetical protein [Solirubrobacter phytolaccae]
MLADTHTDAALEREAARLRAAQRQNTDCAKAIASRLARRPGRAAGIVDDCLVHGGALTRRYPRTVLRRAFKALSHELRQETRCEVGIASQFNAGAGKRLQRTKLARIRPVAAHFAVFDRAKVDADVPAARVRSLIAYENTQGSGLDAENTRRVGDGMWAFRNRTGLCTGLEITTAAVVACTDADRMIGVQAAVTRVPGGVATWGTVADGVTEVRLLDHGGRWRTLATPDNGLQRTTRLLPRLLTWRDQAGTRHYGDFSAYVCLPGVPCPR